MRGRLPAIPRRLVNKSTSSLMRILVINPNTTAAMTAHVAGQLRTHLDKGTAVLEQTATSGTPVIATQSAFDAGAQAVLACLRNAQSEGQLFDQVLLACFGDPGLEDLRLRSALPVTGLAQACMRSAEHSGLPYAIVTAGAEWKAILNHRFTQWGASELFCGTQVIRGTGLDIFSDPLGVLPAVLEGIDAARKGGAQRIILGGAVFAGYKTLMERSSTSTHGLIDCVECAAVALLQQSR